MIMQGSSRKQVLISISSANLKNIIVLLCKHITNINKAFKDIKSDTMANFIWANYKGFTVTTNKVTSMLDFNTIKKYIKNINIINSNNIMVPRLPQSKSYLKILDILYIIKDTNISIFSDVIKKIYNPSTFLTMWFSLQNQGSLKPFLNQIQLSFRLIYKILKAVQRLSL